MSGEEQDSERINDSRRCFVSVELYPEGTSICILGSLININNTGCCVETPTPIKEGVTLRINLLGYAREMSVTCKVVEQRTKPGKWFHIQEIEFLTTMEADTLARFIEFVKQFPASDDSPEWYLKRKRNHE